MLTIAPRISVKVTKSKPIITVGDNSYLLVKGDGTNPNVILTPGKENGHLLLIECGLGLKFTVPDSVKTNRTELSGKHVMKGADTLLLVWSGSRWVEISYTKNS